VVKTEFGFHVVKLEEIKPGKVRSLAEVKDEVAAAIRKEGAKSLAFKQASEAYEKIILSGSLDKFAQSGGIAPKLTGLFNAEVPPTWLKDEPAFMRAILLLKQGELSSIIDGSMAYAVFFAQEARPPSAPLLALVRERVKADYAKEKSVEMAHEAAGKLLAALKAGGRMASEAPKFGVQVQESPFISRVERAGSILPPALLDAGLALTAANPYPKDVQKVEDTSYVLEFKAEKDAAEGLSPQKREELAKRLADENRNRLVVAWESYLHEGAKIEINPAFAAKSDKADAPEEKKEKSAK